MHRQALPPPPNLARFCETGTVLGSSRHAGWRGFEFLDVVTPEAGTFDGNPATNPTIKIYQLHDVLKVRTGSSRNVFKDLPPYPYMVAPGETHSGAWYGTGRGFQLFIETATVERVLHQPFRREMLTTLDGPNPTIEHLLRAFHIDVEHGHPTGPLMGETILLAVLHQILGKAPSQGLSREPHVLSPGKINRLRGWIEDHLDEAFSLEVLASEAGVSVRHLHRAFLAAFGMPPHKYILCRRVERAKSFIHEGRLSLAEIAAAVGFCDQAHMAHTFRKIAKVTPSRYRTSLN